MPLEGVDDLQRLMTDERIGRRADATVIREGEIRRVVVVPGELAGDMPSSSP